MQMNRYLIKGSLFTVTNSESVTQTIKRIWVDGIEILPEVGHGLRPFYECGFDWGEAGGNRSYTAALTICLSVFREERLAENLFVCFKEEFVRYFPAQGFELYIDLSAFLIKYKSRLQPNLYSRFCFSSMINSREILLYKDPLSAEVIADLPENYAMHNMMIPDERLRKLNERKLRLMFRFFVKDRYRIKGNDFNEVVQKAEEIMSGFYWRSLEKILRKKYAEKYRN